MTGRRKYRGKPLAVESAARNSHELFEQRMAAAMTSLQQLAVLWDYFRGALRHVDLVDPQVAAREAQEIKAILTERAHRLQSATVARSRAVKEERANRNSVRRGARGPTPAAARGGARPRDPLCDRFRFR